MPNEAKKFQLFSYGAKKYQHIITHSNIYFRWPVLKIYQLQISSWNILPSLLSCDLDTNHDEYLSQAGIIIAFNATREDQTRHIFYLLSLPKVSLVEFEAPDCDVVSRHAWVGEIVISARGIST